MKPTFPTRPRILPESMERWPEEKGEVSLEILTEDPNDPPKSIERWPEERCEALSSSSMVGMVQIEVAMLENTLSMINQGLAIVTRNNSYALVGDILQRGLWIEPGEATMWSLLDELGWITARMMMSIWFIHSGLRKGVLFSPPKFNSYKWQFGRFVYKEFWKFTFKSFPNLFI